MLDAQIHLYTFKDGLLSRLAHDLLFALERFEIVLEADRLRAHFDPSSLRVLGAMRSGAAAPEPVSAGDQAKILANVQHDVLRVEAHPEIQLDASATRQGDQVQLRGTLTLCGVRQPLELALLRREGRLRGQLELVPSRFGIRPFSALGGALRIKDRVRVAIDACDVTDTQHGSDAPLRWQARP